MTVNLWNVGMSTVKPQKGQNLVWVIDLPKKKKKCLSTQKWKPSSFLFCITSLSWIQLEWVRLSFMHSSIRAGTGISENYIWVCLIVVENLYLIWNALVLWTLPANWPFIASSIIYFFFKRHLLQHSKFRNVHTS